VLDKEGEGGIYIHVDDLGGDLFKRLKLAQECFPVISLPSLDWEKLALIYKIRNIIVHGNSRLSKGDKNYLKSHFIALTGLEDFKIVSLWGDELLLLENQFCHWALDVIENELKKACDRANENFLDNQ
jgi:hypothetical protein